MQTKITFRAMDHSDAIERYAHEKIAKLHKFFKKENQDSVFISMTVESHREHHYSIAELKIKTPQYDLIAKKQGPEMYSVIDYVASTMEKEIAQAKEKHVAGKKHGFVVRGL
jgi:putative sigma-54 modulation protein